jgi:hypothetical protein
MNRVSRRIRRLEGQFVPADRKPRQTLRIVVRTRDRTPSLENATCTRTLCPNGTLMEVVRLDESGEGHEILPHHGGEAELLQIMLQQHSRSVHYQTSPASSTW